MSPLIFAMTLASVGSSPDPSRLLPQLSSFAEARIAEAERIPPERRRSLTRLAEWVRARLARGEEASLTFICTHNSRRSHMSELWARAAAEVYGLAGVKTFSGGTESTAFNPRAVAALRRAGFDIERKSDGDNPRYRVRYADEAPAAEAFSKVFSEAPNPSEGFAAVMTCSQADRSCPFVPGAAFRVPVPYEDPKAHDGTPGEAAAYDERVEQIGREMLFLMSRARP